MTRTSLEKSRIKVLLVEGVHSSAVEAFRADGYSDIDYSKTAPSKDELAERLRDVFFLGIRSQTQVRADVLERAPRLTAIGCFCIGTDQVDLNAAQDLGIPVFNAPFSNTRSVAELVLAETILLMRGIPFRSAQARRGVWVKTASASHEVRGKVLGIVGYGHIGTQVGLLAEALGMQVFYYDIEAKLTLGNAKPVASLEALLQASDVVTLHVPDTPQTRGMIGAEQLSRMKPGARLINTSRGKVVDIDALAEALRSGTLSGAAIDVFPVEPSGGGDEFVSPLRDEDKALLTPHIGGSTVEAQHNIGLEVAGKLIKYSNNGSTLTAVNFPEVALPEHAGKHRLLHIHCNRPGVLSAVNAVFSEHRINIAGQYLQTNARIGYVVIDIEGDDRAEGMVLKQKLDSIAGTIRTRILY